MPPAFDPYHQWLGIRPEEHPVDHYRLLGLVRFENDRDVISNACDRLMSHVRTFQVGPRGLHTQEVLTRLAAARACLLDASAKATYDAVLHGQIAAEAKAKAATAQHAAAMASAHEPMTAVLTPPPPPLVVAPPPVEYGSPPRSSQVKISPDRPRASLLSDAPVEYVDKPVPAYLQPWALVLAVAGVLLVAVSVWGLGLLIGGGQEQAQAPPVETALEIAAPPAIVEEPPAEDAVYIQQEAGGELNFTAGTAQLSGNARLAQQDGQSVITQITSLDDRVRWHFRVATPGPFRIEATYAAPPGSEGGTFKLSAGGQTTKAIVVRNTGTSFTSERVGFLWIRRGGKHKLVLKPASLSDGQPLMTLQSLRFVPAGGQ